MSAGKPRIEIQAVMSLILNRWNWYTTSILMSPYTTDIVYRNSIDLARSMLAGVNGLVSVATEYVTKEHLTAARASGGDAMDLDPDKGTFMSGLYHSPQRTQFADSPLRAFSRHSRRANF